MAPATIAATYPPPWTDRIGLMILAFAVRAATFHQSVIDIDESMYMLVAREILAGRLPYLAIFQEKPLGMPVILALVMGIAGPSLLIVRLLGATAVAVTAILVRDIARAAHLSRPASLVGGALYVLMSTRLGGLATNTEILLAPFSAGAALIVLRRWNVTSPTLRLRGVLSLGACVGLGIWLKYLPAIPGAILFALLLSRWWWLNPTGPDGLGTRHLVALSAVFASACLVPTALGALFYASQGLWGEFWHQNFAFMRFYVAVPETTALVERKVVPHLFQISTVLILAAFGLRRWRVAPHAALMLAVWLLAECLALIAPWKFFDHYFLLLLPPLCALTALAVESMRRPGASATPLTLVGAMILLERGLAYTPWIAAGQDLSFLLFPGLLLFALACHILLRRWDSARAPGRLAPAVGIVAAVMLVAAVVGLYGPVWRVATRPDHAREIARQIVADAGPRASIWIVNSEPAIYLHADSPIPTKFVFPPFLVSPFSAVTGIDTDAEVGRILTARPRYLVVDPRNWSWTSPATTNLIQQAIARHYQPFGQAATTTGWIMLYKLSDMP